MMAVGMEIASFYAKIGADVKDFKKGLGDVKDDMNGLEKTSDALGKAFNAAFKVGVAAAAAFTAVIGASVKNAANFEQGVADIGAMMTLTDKEAQTLGDHILDLGLDPKLKVTATEASDAIMALGTAGVSATEIMNGASEATVRLANATGLKGGSGFASAANIATDVMAQFNIKASNMDEAINQVVGTTVASKFTIDDYRLAIAQAGGVAGLVGVSFEDFNATIAATSSSFSGGSDAGTSFKVFLQRLAPDTAPAKEALKELGLMAADGSAKFFDAAGNLKSMEEVAGLLQGAVIGLSDAQKIQTFSTLFGTDAMRTALTLADGGTAIIAKMKGEIGKVDAEELAAKRMDTFKGSMEIAMGVIETLSISIGQKFLPVLRPLVDKFTELAQKYGPMVVDWFGQVAAKIGEVITDFLGLKTSVTDGTGAITTGVKTVTDGFAVLASTAQKGKDTFVQLKGVLTGNQEVVQSLTGTFGSFVQGFWNTIDAIKLVFKPLTDTIAKFVTWKDVMTSIGLIMGGMLLSAIGGIVVALWPVIQTIGLVTAAVAALRWAWQNDFMGIQTTTRNTLNKLSDWFYNESGIWKGTWEDTLEYLKWWADGGWKNFVFFPVRSWLIKIGSEIQIFKLSTTNKLAEWIQDVKDFFSGLYNDTVRIFTVWKDKIISFFQDAFGPTLFEIGQWVDRALSTFNRWSEWTKKYLREASEAIRDWARDALAWFKPSEWLQKGKDIIDGLWDGAKSIWNNFKNWWSGLWRQLTGTVDVKLRIGSPSKEMIERGIDTVKGFAVGAEKAMPLVHDAMSGLSMGAMNAGSYGSNNTPAVSTSRIEELLVMLIQELRAKNMTVNVAGGGDAGYSSLVYNANRARI